MYSCFLLHKAAYTRPKSVTLPYREERSPLPILTGHVFENLSCWFVTTNRVCLARSQLHRQPPHFAGGLSCCCDYSTDAFHAKRRGQSLSTQAWYGSAVLSSKTNLVCVRKSSIRNIVSIWRGEIFPFDIPVPASTRLRSKLLPVLILLISKKKTV